MYRTVDALSLFLSLLPPLDQVVAAKAGLESRQFPLFEEPTHTVVFDFAFKRDSYFDGAAGRMVREGERLQHPGERVDF